MKPARIILLLVALVAGVLAAFLVVRGSGEPTPDQVVTEVMVEEAKTQVLVARTPIGMGERLTVDTVEWQDWPEGAIRPEYVTIGAMPDAPVELTGAVARFEFFPGEPIRQQKLVNSEQGYLSAVLSQGMRGVSVSVSAASSAGGFVVPNDKVDVMLTRRSDGGDTSEVILPNVRVLAIGKRLGEVGASGGAVEGADPAAGPQAQVFDETAIATLELDPSQAETLINSVSLGQLSLVLRSIVDFNDDTVAKTDATNQSVKIIRYGREMSVMSGNTGQQIAQQAVGMPVVPAAPTYVEPNFTPAVAVEPTLTAQ